MMTLWCIFRSPLMIGADLPQLDQATEALLTNAQVLSLLKDPAPARQLLRDDSSAVWQKGSCVALFNLSDSPAEVGLPAASLGLEPGRTYSLQDLWEKTCCRPLQVSGPSCRLSARLEAHGSRLYRLS